MEAVENEVEELGEISASYGRTNDDNSILLN